MKGRTQAETAIITNEKITKNKSTTENANSKRSLASALLAMKSYQRIKKERRTE